MGRGAWCVLWSAGALAAALGCPREQPQPVPPGPVFPGGPAPRPYAPPPDGNLIPRYAQKLLQGTREGLRFAKERLGERGAAAEADLLALLRPRVDDEGSFAEVVNLCDALARTGTAAAKDALLDVLRRAPVPVSRSAAADALGALRIGEAAAAMAEHGRREAEPAVVERILRSLGQLGGAEAAAFLEEKLRQGIEPNAPAEAQRQANLAWHSLLLLGDEGAAERLRRLAESLGPLPRLQALVTRMELGESGLEGEVAEFLDPQPHPSGQVRALAVDGLVFAKDWTRVLAAASDPDPQVRAAVAKGLRQAPASAEGAQACLERLAQDAEGSVRVEALRSLLTRGDRRPLEPWLRQLREYPTGAGSVEALNLLAAPGLADPRTRAILVSRWPACDRVQKQDVLRALGTLGDPAALPHVESVLADGKEDAAVRETAATAAANLGPQAVPVLLRRLDHEISGREAEAVLSGLARYARQSEEARARLLAVAADRAAPDALRKLAFDLLPRALGEGALAPLLAARDAEPRGEVRAYLDGLLAELF